MWLVVVERIVVELYCARSFCKIHIRNTVQLHQSVYAYDLSGEHTSTTSHSGCSHILLHQRMSCGEAYLCMPSKRHNSSTRKVFLRVLISKLHVVVTVRKNASLSKIPVR